MELHQLSKERIGLVCEQVEKFLAASGVERREMLRIKLALEEVLLDYQAALGEESTFAIRCAKRISSTRVEVIAAGAPVDPFSKAGEEADVIRGLLAGIGLAPTWSYRNGKNYIVFTPKKKPVSGTVKMLAAVGLATLVYLAVSVLQRPKLGLYAPAEAVVRAEGDATGLEHTVRELLACRYERRCFFGVVILDCGMNEAGRAVAQLLERENFAVELLTPEEFFHRETTPQNGDT